MTRVSTPLQRDVTIWGHERDGVATAREEFRLVSVSFVVFLTVQKKVGEKS